MQRLFQYFLRLQNQLVHNSNRHRLWQKKKQTNKQLITHCSAFQFCIDPGSVLTESHAAINAIANPHVPEIGERFLGTVVKLATFGAFVSLLPGKDGLLHVSELKKISGGKRVENVEDVLEVGQKILVEIAKIDDRGKLSLVPVVEDEAKAE